MAVTSLGGRFNSVSPSNLESLSWASMSSFMGYCRVEIVCLWW